jgi:hypothetical protein
VGTHVLVAMLAGMHEAMGLLEPEGETVGTVKYSSSR